MVKTCVLAPSILSIDRKMIVSPFKEETRLTPVTWLDWQEHCSESEAHREYTLSLDESLQATPSIMMVALECRQSKGHFCLGLTKSSVGK